MSWAPWELSSLADITKALQITRPWSFSTHPHMEICFKLATKPAVKGTIAVVSCVSIAYIAAHAKSRYRTSCALLIGIISVVIRTYQTPPHCASCTSWTMTSDALSSEGIKAQLPHPILTCFFGKPIHKQIKTVICKLLANLMAILCPWGHS